MTSTNVFLEKGLRAESGSDIPEFPSLSPQPYVFSANFIRPSLRRKDLISVHKQRQNPSIPFRRYPYTPKNPIQFRPLPSYRNILRFLPDKKSQNQYPRPTRLPKEYQNPPPAHPNALFARAAFGPKLS